MSKQELIEWCYWRISQGNEGVRAEASYHVAVIALDSLTVEPVGYIDPDSLKKYRGKRAGGSWLCDAKTGEYNQVTPIFTHPVPDLAALVPDGWKMVPVEPTEDMVIKGFESEPDASFSTSEDWKKYEAMSGCQKAAYRARLCWETMVAAAPTEFPRLNNEDTSNA